MRAIPTIRRRPSVPIPLAALTAGAAAALASALAWLLDRDLGARRRHRLADAGISLWRRAGAAAEATARDAMNRASGVAARLRAAVRDEAVDDPVLEARVRTALGRAARHAGAVTVAASGGTVTLSGPALRDEAPRILAAAWNVRGVLAIFDRLEVRDEPGDIPALQGAGPQPEPRPDVLQRTWAPTTRLVAVVGGGVAAIVGLARGGLIGLGAALAGGLVALRGATNLELGRMVRFQSLLAHGRTTAGGRETTIDEVVPAEPMADAPAEPMADALAQGEFSIPPLERTREAHWPEPAPDAADPERNDEPGDETSGYAPVDAVTDAFRRD